MGVMGCGMSVCCTQEAVFELEVVADIMAGGTRSQGGLSAVVGLNGVIRYGGMFQFPSSPIAPTCLCWRACKVGGMLGWVWFPGGGEL